MDWQRIFERTEYYLEQTIFASRWLLAPFYAGLAISIVVLLVKFMIELTHLLTHAFTSTESDVILGVLALVDLALTGSLLIIVIFSGYENFVSKIDHSGHRDWPEWMGTIDFAALKLKLLSSIVAISAIQLLKHFMSVKVVTPEQQATLFWLVVIHVVFVVSSVLLALSDRIAGHGGGHGPETAPAGNGHGQSGATPAAGGSDAASGGKSGGKGLSHASAEAPTTAAKPVRLIGPVAQGNRRLH